MGFACKNHRTVVYGKIKMAFTTGIFLVALLCTASCGPMGETILSNILPNGGTTVCESTPNVLGNVGLGLGALGLNLPPSLLLQLLTQTLVPTLGSTTVCDSVPNIGLPVISPYGLPLNTGIGSTTVCDSIPNLGLPVLQNSLPSPGQTTVCESASNISPLPYGLNLPGRLNSLIGSTTVCESSPNVNSPLGLPLGLPAMGLSGLGVPYPRQLGGFGLGLPLNSLGLPLNGLGLPLNGLGLPLNGLGGLALNPYGLPIL